MKAREFVPHSGIMARLDEIVSVNDTALVGALTIRDDDPFMENGTVPAWAAIEYMAQTIAAYAGYHAKQRGEPVATGFLLGSRRFESTIAGFPSGTRLTVSVTANTLGTEGLSSFACHVDVNGAETVTATLNVYKPKNLEAYLEK